MSVIQDNNVNILSETSDNISLSDKYCNICTENIESNQLVTLSCNPNHYFCYTCIFDWYNTIKYNSSAFSFGGYDNKQCTCPICKKDGDVLPLLPPHTENIIGIHVKGTPLGFGSNTSSFGGVITSFGGVTSSFGTFKCHHKNCTFQYSHINLHSKNKLYKNLCYTHYYDFKKGKNITLENDEIFESPYIQCDCKMPNNQKCMNTTMYNKMYSTTLNNKKYYFCNDHTKLYNHGIQLTLNDNIIAVKESTHKMICSFPNNKLKYGYCLHKLNNDGLCKTESHHKNKTNLCLKDSDIFGDSDTDTQSDIEDKKVMNCLCGTTLKNGKGSCLNKGKDEFNGKCGKHKNS